METFDSLIEPVAGWAADRISAVLAAGEEVVIQRETTRTGLVAETLTVSIPADRAYVFDGEGKRLR